MLENYFKIAIRHFRRRPGYTLINIFGLALGIAFCALIFLFVRSEFGYDRFHLEANRIYRLHRVPTEANEVFKADVAMPMPLGPALQETFPGVEDFVRFSTAEATVRRQGTILAEESVVFADTSFFDVFTFPLLAGDPSAALDDPNGVVLTERLAQKYFGDEANPMGKSLSIRLFGQYHIFRVTGVAQEPPDNSSIRFGILLPFDVLFQANPGTREQRDQWISSSVITYVKLTHEHAAQSIEAQMSGFLHKRFAGMLKMAVQRGLLSEEKLPFTYRLQPLTDIHLNPNVPAGFTTPNSPRYSYILSAIALAVLLIACINFMTLAMGLSATRAKEVGMRKVVGARRRQLMSQFWVESLFLSFVALLLGVLVANIFLPVFNDITGRALTFEYFQNASTWIALTGLLGFTGLIAGSYPALALSGFAPISALQGESKLQGTSTFTRSLVVIQFTLSIILVTVTLAMAYQLDYLKSKKLGFSGEQVVIIPSQGLDGERLLERYSAAASSQPNIAGVAGANASIGQGFSRRGFQYEGQIKEASVFRVTPNFLTTLRMNLLRGSSFAASSQDKHQGAGDGSGTSVKEGSHLESASNGVIINEAFAREFGWQNPVGRTLPVEWGVLTNPTVIGVVQDFHFYSLRDAVEPAVLYTSPLDPIQSIYVRLRADDIRASLEFLRGQWEALTGDVAFQYYFLDSKMDQLYRSEERWGKIVSYGSVFAILISCMGLFGLASLVTARRTKEIGIRKVLGANVPNLVALLSKDFVKLVAIAFIVAAPVAYFAMQKWLQDFAYRVEPGPLLFAGAGGLAVLVALVTVSYQAIRAATMDPVNALRAE